jgi:ribose-phosphate pyrophosphokinase
MIVIPGPSSRELGVAISKELSCRKVDVEYKVFPDGESYLRIAGKVEGEEVVIVQSTYRPQDTHVFQLISLSRTARDLGADRVVAVVPYLAYARQAERYREGEAVTSKIMAEMLEFSGVDSLITVDVHSEAALKSFKIRAQNISSIPAVVEYIKSIKGIRDPVVVAPDKEREKHVSLVAENLGADHIYLTKHRDRITGKVTTTIDDVSAKKIRGKDALIVDDIISTGDTMLNAINLVKEAGSRKVCAICTHPVLASGALERLMASGLEDIAATDTIPSPISKISVAPLIANFLRKC